MGWGEDEYQTAVGVGERVRAALRSACAVVVMVVLLPQSRRRKGSNLTAAAELKWVPLWDLINYFLIHMRAVDQQTPNKSSRKRIRNSEHPNVLASINGQKSPSCVKGDQGR